MKRAATKYLYKIVISCMALTMPISIGLMTFVPRSSAREPILEKDIVTFISEMEYYANEGNVDELLKYIDADASFAIASKIGVEPALVRIDNMETFFARGFEGVDSYDLDLNIDTIAIEGQVATVTGTTVDRSVKGDIETVSTMAWRNVIEEQDGELQVIQWESRMTGYAVREIEQ